MPGMERLCQRASHHLIVPEMTVAVEVDGRVVGGTTSLPNFNPRIRDINSQLFPFGFIHLLPQETNIKRNRIIFHNVFLNFRCMAWDCC